MIYLKSAAAVKLAHAEPESAALRGWLDERAETEWISSVLTEIESFRLGAALRARPSLTSFVTYDKRLLDAAQAAGLPIDSPT